MSVLSSLFFFHQSGHPEYPDFVTNTHYTADVKQPHQRILQKQTNFSSHYMTVVKE